MKATDYIKQNQTNNTDTVWNAFREENGQWVEDQKLEGHSDWVRDVAWAPSIGLPRNIIASCSQVRLQVGGETST